MSEIKTIKQLDDLAKLISSHYKEDLPDNLVLQIQVNEQDYEQFQIQISGGTFEEMIFTYFHDLGITFEIETCC